MSDEIVLYTNPMSRGRIVRWMLEETGAPYRAELVGYGPAMKTPAYLAINPMGKVPAITHRGAVVTECAAICAYLADAFPEAGLAPATNTPARGTYYRALFFAAGPLEAAVTQRAIGYQVAKDKEGMAGHGNPELTLDALERMLKGRTFVAGDRFSAADLYLASHLGWGMQFGTVERRPAFEGYIKPHFARPAAAKARAIDDKLLAEQQQKSGPPPKG